MEKVADRRYQTAKSVLEALVAAVEGGKRVPDTTARGRQAVAVFVDVSTAGVDAQDEALFDDVADVLDLAERRLHEAGLTSLLHTGTSLLSARVLPEQADAGSPDEVRVREQARALVQQLAGRPAPHPQVTVKVLVHVDEAELQGSPSAPVVTGRIVDVTSWPASAALVA
jgi:hypothetical protein